MTLEERIKTLILDELNGKDGLYSVKIQNHIYGCFVLMEDIAQGRIDVFDHVVQYSEPPTNFNYNTQFSEIGIKYGFVSNDNLILNEYSTEYKTIWLECFHTMDLVQDIELSDKIEDILINAINSYISGDSNYFNIALENGTLTDEAINKLTEMLKINEEVPPTHSASVEAASHEKVLKSHHSKRAHHTRRKKVPANTQTINKKKIISTTRRHNK
jgi:hypothetical protein